MRRIGASGSNPTSRLVDISVRANATRSTNLQTSISRTLRMWRGSPIGARCSVLRSWTRLHRRASPRNATSCGSEETQNFATPPSGNPEQDAKRPKAKRSGATVNRYLAALSVCLSYGVKTLQWLERNPCERITKSRESKGRVRFLSDDERKRLLTACRKSENKDLYLAVILSLTTGAREAEIMTLRWGQIDFKRKVITLHDTKNGERRALPLVGEAYKLLDQRAKVRSLTDDRLFPPKPRARKAECIDLNAPWVAARKAAGLTDFHWHDLRHTAASYLAMSGVSLVEIAKVLGHRTLAMVARYSHLSDGHIVSTGEKLASRLGVGK